MDFSFSVCFSFFMFLGQRFLRVVDFSPVRWRGPQALAHVLSALSALLPGLEAVAEGEKSSLALREQAG